MKLGEMTLEEAAKTAAGNWRQFDSFFWHRAHKLSDSDRWCIVYTCNRDSGILDMSNADAIGKALERFAKGRNPDVLPEHHSHWACGSVDGFSIRVFKRGKITKAFKTYHALAQRLANYPLLHEEDYCRREYEATVSNLDDAAWKLKREYHLPEGWQDQVYGWLADNDPSAIESTDDQGGFPDEDQLRAAFDALG